MSREPNSVEEITPPICIKLDISPKIIPRDTSLGTKVLILVPPQAQTVRDVKSHIANFVLRTPSPFHFFVGEYRLREDENAVIFSLINEPCRLMPVPLPKPALSSTPKQRRSVTNDGNSSSSSQKRVTFFDGDSSTSPVGRLSMSDSANGMDVLDHSNIAITPFPSNFYVAQVQSNEGINVGESGEAKNDSEMEEVEKEKKRKRRRCRKHRTKKAKPIKDESEDETMSSNDRSALSPEPKVPSTSSSNGENTLKNLMYPNEETESEDETGMFGVEFPFVAPTTSTPSTSSRKRTNSSCSTITPESRDHQESFKRRKQLTRDSAFVSDGSLDDFASPITGDANCNGKSRQDTPIVPRVVKNPKTFEAARKLLHSQMVPVPETELGGNNQFPRRSPRKAHIKPDLEESGNQNQASDHQGVPIKSDPKKSKDSPSQSNILALCPVNTIDEINVGDVLTFQVLEMDGRYNPIVSDFKEGIVCAKAKSGLSLRYTKNNVVQRSGKLELPSSGSGTDEEGDGGSDQSYAVLQFSELLNVRFVSRVGDNGESQDISSPSVESLPPSVI